MPLKEPDDNLYASDSVSNGEQSEERPPRVYTTQASIAFVTVIEVVVAIGLLFAAMKAETTLQTILATSGAVILVAALLVTQRIVLRTNKSLALWKSTLISATAPQNRQPPPPPPRARGGGDHLWRLNVLRTQVAINATVGVEALIALGFLYFSTQPAYSSIRYFLASIGVIILMAALITTQYIILQTNKEVDEFVTKAPKQFVGEASLASFKRLYELSLEIHRGLKSSQDYVLGSVRARDSPDICVDCILYRWAANREQSAFFDRSIWGIGSCHFSQYVYYYAACKPTKE